MDLGSECSTLELFEDNEAAQIKDKHAGDHETENHVKGTAETVQPMLSPLVAVKSPGASSSPTTKGYGLKKRRRIKRDFVKDATITMERSKIVKRGLTGSANPDPSKPQHSASSVINQSSGSPNGSMNMLKNAVLAPGFMMHSPNSDSIFAVGAAFGSATDSENSEDRSSKSSTAASMPTCLQFWVTFMRDTR
ncbi:WPP domain-interacting protein 1-like [Hibiscus syriacus]|uniref:WPP domain-interacting protein 1-like n=1 Tax=Hibiscus syriacus TaxID=106335 RepID=UPI0019218C74|nr:WPP domain-interacting protein 1-like [Hibiscus syriacus]